MSSIKRVRNWECLPHVECEGSFDRPVLIQTYDDDRHCHGPWRLDKHHTLSSIRRHRSFRPYKHLVPKDALDFSLASTYDHGSEMFPDTEDIHLQPETLGRDTWRRLRNTRDVTPDRVETVSVKIKTKGKKHQPPYHYNSAHEVVIGGIADKNSLDHCKLMVSSIHGPISKNGYVRQQTGNSYCY